MQDTHTHNSPPLKTRMRRRRSAPWIREMLTETRLHVSDLIWPVFVTEGQNAREAIPSMPDIERTSLDLLIEKAKEAADLGIPALAIFPVIDLKLKTPDGAESFNPNNLMCRTISALKSQVPEIGLITDVALDPYTSHGHDGILEDGIILNDATIEILCKQAVAQAQAGADIIAPSDMMDGRVRAIRHALDLALPPTARETIMIMSYAAKYASSFYGPFRDAVSSAGTLKGDKETYQMNPANAKEALQEIALDIEEGADMLIVKPGTLYLDIVQRVKEAFNRPTFAYHVSGEYSMLKAAAAQGYLEYEPCMMETLLAFKRAGCDGILTYSALDAAKILNTNP